MSNEHREQAREIVRVEQRTQTDCLRCCLAMVTAIDYDDVPDFVADHGESWPTACEAWLGELGMGLLMMPTAPTYVPPWLPIIARGSTEYSDEHHFVVVTPNAVIDPSPSQHRLKEAAATYAVVNSGSLANELINHLAAKYSETHSALSSRDSEIREVLEGLGTQVEDGLCWCPDAGSLFDGHAIHGIDCQRTRTLYAKLQPDAPAPPKPIVKPSRRKSRKEQIEEELRASDLSGQLAQRDNIEYGPHDSLPRGEHVARLGNKAR